ncbi:MAG: multidrug ABC transporter ATP-binding protein [Gammaproteobacteria bacterium SG8_11]|nr:MAG: multidrug ABC transporter ATP-binding protein [Gammaproteobacteria bacterium SG8_11]
MELKIENLSKTYSNGIQALKNVDLTISQGMFGLLGPNGAGKTTLMRTIAALQEPDSGSIFLDELDVLNNRIAFRRILGYLPQEFGVYNRINAESLLNHLAVLKGIIDKKEREEQVKALLELTGLYQHRKRNVSTYSGGMRQRFGIAQALLGKPSLIIVDEPTAGLDPAGRNQFYNILSEIGENIIVILSTHIVEDVKELCPNMAIISQGNVLFQGKTQDALDEYKDKVWEKIIKKNELADYQKHYNMIFSKLIAGKPVIHVLSDTIPDNGFKKVEVDLEDVFFSELVTHFNQKPK